jgi:hypothetical protein
MKPQKRSPFSFRFQDAAPTPIQLANCFKLSHKPPHVPGILVHFQSERWTKCGERRSCVERGPTYSGTPGAVTRYWTVKASLLDIHEAASEAPKSVARAVVLRAKRIVLFEVAVSLNEVVWKMIEKYFFNKIILRWLGILIP